MTQAGITVVALPTPDLEQTLTEIRLVGQLVHAYPAADTLATSLQRRIDAVKHKAAGAAAVTVYMEADYSTPGKPYTFGGGSFPDEMIRDAGGANVFGSDTEADGYPQVSDEAVIAANPQIIILTEDPSYGGNPQLVYSRPGWSAIAAVKSQKVYAIDGNLVGRTGPRIVDGLEQLAKDLHPDLFS
jgi:iron complex transport system substrate-binding protein